MTTTVTLTTAEAQTTIAVLTERYNAATLRAGAALAALNTGGSLSDYQAAEDERDEIGRALARFNLACTP